MSAHFTFEAIGTTWKIDVPGDIDAAGKDELLSAIRARIDEFDRAYSRFRADSLVTEMSKKAGTYRLPDDALPMMTLYRELYDLTGGLVTPLVGQVLSDAGYDAKYSLRPRQAIAPARRWEDVMEYQHPFLTLYEPALLDFGALGKGYLIDIVAGVIRARGFESYTVDAGGDIAHRGGLPFRVGLEDPEDARNAVGVAEIGNASIAGSAGNRRAWDRFHHIIDPVRVESPRHILGLWTVADTTMLADGLSTALFFVGPEKLMGKYAFEYALLFADRSAALSRGFPGSFFGA